MTDLLSCPFCGVAIGRGMMGDELHGLDAGIAGAVSILRSGGVETFESCEGGEGHCFPEPTVRFHGTPWAGFKAFAVAMEHGLPVLSVRLAYHEDGGQLDGPYWEIVFRTKVPEQ